MVQSRWKGGLPRSARKQIQKQQRNARRREKYASENVGISVDKKLFDWKRDNLEVGLVYKRNSKIMPAPKGYVAVRLKTGERGWVKEGESKFISNEDNEHMMASVDKAAHTKTKYQWMYGNMDAKQKARFMERAADIDWSDFWKLHYNGRTGLLDSEGIETMEEIMNYAYEGKLIGP